MPHGVNFYEHFGILENGAKSYGYNLKGFSQKEKSTEVALKGADISYIWRNLVDSVAKANLQI